MKSVFHVVEDEEVFDQGVDFQVVELVYWLHLNFLFLHFEFE